MQFLAVQLPGMRIVVADKFSRGRPEEVLADVAAAGLVREKFRPLADSAVILRLAVT